MSDIEFVKGLIVKTPTDKTPDYVKAKMSFKVQELIAWLQSKNAEWVNVEMPGNRRYCSLVNHERYFSGDTITVIDCRLRVSL